MTSQPPPWPASLSNSTGLVAQCINVSYLYILDTSVSIRGRAVSTPANQSKDLQCNEQLHPMRHLLYMLPFVNSICVTCDSFLPLAKC